MDSTLVETIRGLGIPTLVATLSTLVVEGLLRQRAHRQRLIDRRRATVIARFYASLDSAHVALEAAASPGNGPEQRRAKSEEARRLANRMRDAFQRNRVWFRAATGKRVDELWKEIKDAGFAVEDSMPMAGGPPPQSLTPARVRLKQSIPELRGKVEEEMRRAVGIS